MPKSWAAAIAALFLMFANGAAFAADPVPRGRLPRTVMPLHAALEVKIDPSRPDFSGTVVIDVDVRAATRTVWLHGRDMEVTQASVTPDHGPRQPLAARLADASGVLQLSAPKPIRAGRARIEIRYQARFSQTQGAYRVKPGGLDYVLTHMEPAGARLAFPCFDEPGFKHPWDLSLIVPQAQQGVANTRMVRAEAAGEGWKKLVFATTERLPSYLIAFAVGPWDVVEGPDLAPNAVRGQPIQLRGIAAKGQGERMKYALEQTGAIVAAEEAYFGIPYPFDKLDLLAAPDFAAGAMENPGLIVYRDALLFANERSEVGQLQRFWGTHAHELAHQWFGNLVTMPWWDDVWLNEAFATWFATKIVGRLQPGFRTDRYALERTYEAMASDSLASTRRVQEPIASFTDIRSAFDNISYTKGAALLSMYERYLGEAKFQQAIRTYMRRHARGSATSPDLIDAIASVSESPQAVRDSMQRFTSQPGVPLLNVTTLCDANGVALQVEQRRFLPVGSSAPSQGVWRVPLCVRWGDAGGAHEQCALVDGRVSRMPLNTSSCPAWVMPNANAAGYWRFALSAADQARLEQNLAQLSPREQRAYADSIEAAFTAGALDAPAYLRSVRLLAAVEDSGTAMAPLRRLKWMVHHLASTPGERQGLRDVVGRLYGPRLERIGIEPQAGESTETRALRKTLIETMALVARDPALRTRLAVAGRAVLGLAAAGEPGGDARLHPDAVPADLRAAALRMAMEEGGEPVEDALLRHLAGTLDPELRVQLLSAASHATQPGLAERARGLALVPDTLRRNEIEWVLPGADDDPEALPSGRQWLEAHFDALERRIRPGARTLVRAYASGLCSAEAAEATQRKFGARVQDSEGGPRSLRKAVEGVRLCGALVARQRTASPLVP